VYEICLWKLSKESNKIMVGKPQFWKNAYIFVKIIAEKFKKDEIQERKEKKSKTNQEFVCECCNETIVGFDNWKQHIYVCGNDDGYIIKCKYEGCNHVCMGKKYHYQHKKVHSPTKYVCKCTYTPGRYNGIEEKCEYSSVSKSECIKHMKTWHGKVNFENTIFEAKKKKYKDVPDPIRNKYKCNYCSQDFCHHSGLIHHIRAAHNGKTNDIPTHAVFECKECGIKYKNIVSYHRHYRKDHLIQVCMSYYSNLKFLKKYIIFTGCQTCTMYS